MRRHLRQARLVTLTGPPGIGKTRLALQVAGDLIDAYRDGAWFVDLSGLTDPGLIRNAVAWALNIREPALLEARLKLARSLILLDNCEHLRDGVASAAITILSACPEVHLLVTTRQPLHVDGEVVWRLPALAEAEQLFCERAALVQPAFQWSLPVAKICGLAEGLPLAIELAAARVSLMSIEELAAAMGTRFRLLRSASGSAPPRQRSLTAAVDWSYELLSADERLLFGRLAVFVGGFRLEAAEAVAGDGLPDVQDAVFRLVDKSLLSPVAAAGGRTRYRMLETLREYALARLEENGEIDNIRRLHCAYFRELSESNYVRGGGTNQQAQLERLAEDLDNILAALSWSQTHDAEGLLRLARALGFFWLVRGLFREGRGWLEAAVAGSTERNSVRADALFHTAILAYVQGDLEATVPFNREAAEIYRKQQEWGQLARVLNNLAVCIREKDEQLALLQEGLESARRSGDPAVLGLLLSTTAIRLHRDDNSAAQALLEESLALRRQADNPWGVARSLLFLGHLALDRGDSAAAGARLAEALDIVGRLGDQPGLALTLAAFARHSPEPARALRLAAFTDTLQHAIGDQMEELPGTELQNQLRELRGRLGPEAAAVEGEGRAMSLEQAVELALAPHEVP